MTLKPLPFLAAANRKTLYISSFISIVVRAGAGCPLRCPLRCRVQGAAVVPLIIRARRLLSPLKSLWHTPSRTCANCYTCKLLHFFTGIATTAACPAARRCERIWRLGGRGQRASVDVNDSDKDSSSSSSSSSNSSSSGSNDITWRAAPSIDGSLTDAEDADCGGVRGEKRQQQQQQQQHMRCNG